MVAPVPAARGRWEWRPGQKKTAVITNEMRTINVPSNITISGKMISRQTTPPAVPMAQPLPDTRPISPCVAISGSRPL
ncbi:MAG: hypothetical protein M5U34_28825 [Chloroflexi bacterium]|nr:hypothetical protein [Chloroflexota bacterium]